MLAVSILGRFGLSLEEPCRQSLRCLDYFDDPHARQHSLTVQTLLKKITEHVKGREVRFQRQRKQASSQLFGLLSSTPASTATSADIPNSTEDFHSQEHESLAKVIMEQGRMAESSMYSTDVFAAPWFCQNVDEALQDFLQPVRQGLNGSFADIPLFPMNDQTSLLFQGDGPDMS